MKYKSPFMKTVLHAGMCNNQRSLFQFNKYRSGVSIIYGWCPLCMDETNHEGLSRFFVSPDLHLHDCVLIDCKCEDSTCDPESLTRCWGPHSFSTGTLFFWTAATRRWIHGPSTPPSLICLSRKSPNRQEILFCQLIELKRKFLPVLNRMIIGPFFRFGSWDLNFNLHTDP